jgi:hypothetical protein
MRADDHFGEGCTGRPVRPPLKFGGGVNAQEQRAAFNAMSECEQATGKTAEQLRADHQEQRARVLARYGLQEAA